MTPLRERMIEDMQRRNLSDETQRNYTHYIAEYARHFNISPDQLAPEAIREYQLFLANDRKMPAQSVNCFTAAAKFLYQTTLEMPWSQAHFVRSHVPETLPVVLGVAEVAQFFQAVGILKHREALMTCYGAGLGISEAVSLKIGDIDSSRMVIRVQQGKGAKDRYVNLPERLLTVLREYCRRQQQVCRESAHLAGIDKRVTAHTLRHYAGFTQADLQREWSIARAQPRHLAPPPRTWHGWPASPQALVRRWSPRTCSCESNALCYGKPLKFEQSTVSNLVEFLSNFPFRSDAGQIGLERDRRSGHRGQRPQAICHGEEAYGTRHDRPGSHVTERYRHATARRGRSFCGPQPPITTPLRAAFDRLSAQIDACCKEERLVA